MASSLLHMVPMTAIPLRIFHDRTTHCCRSERHGSNMKRTAGFDTSYIVCHCVSNVPSEVDMRCFLDHTELPWVRNWSEQILVRLL